MSAEQEYCWVHSNPAEGLWTHHKYDDTGKCVRCGKHSPWPFAEEPRVEAKVIEQPKPKRHGLEFTILFFSQVISYSLVTVGFLKLAERNMPATLLADALNASFGFFVIRRIARSDDSVHGWIGYVLGSLVGTAIGMCI